MVHGFKIENDKLILDIEEILQYPLLQQIYARDAVSYTHLTLPTKLEV